MFRPTMSTTKSMGSRRSNETDPSMEWEEEKVEPPFSASVQPAPTKRRRWKRFWSHLTGVNEKNVGWRKSIKRIVKSSWLNILFIFVPLSWVAHFKNNWNDGVTLALCFVAIIPLEKLFDWGGEQLAAFCPPNVGSLIVITLKNAVEATLAIILVVRCEMQLLQSTIVGVVLLHILVVPGAAFLTGGAKVLEQELTPHHSGVNPSLLAVGVMALVVPVGFFAATDKTALLTGESPDSFVSDTLRQNFLRISRGFAVILLVIYIGSRIYINEETDDVDKPVDPKVNPGACIILVVVTVALMGVTAEFLVDSIEFVREESDIEEEWFGLILLPIISFSADGLLNIVSWLRASLPESVLEKWKWLRKPDKVLPTTREDTTKPIDAADARAIDLSIQFLLFWMPFVTLLAWWLDKPMTLLFDLFEVTSLIGTCFLVNAVIADGKTNWVEGMVLVCFYIMIALAAWYYPGQPEIRVMDACESVASALVASKLPNS